MRLVVLVCLGACGRIGFDATARAGDGGPIDAAIDTPVGAACVADIDCGRCARCEGEICRVEPVNTLFLGHRMTCFLGAGGSRWCMGQNDNGDLGVGDALPHAIPTRIVGDDHWTELFLGYTDSYGVKEDGHLYHWGNSQLTPMDMGPTGAFHRIILDDSNRCAVRTNATLDCDPTGATWASFDVGSQHQCGIKLGGGALFCWGTDQNGDLGLGLANVGMTFANPMQVGTDTDWAEVGAGQAFSCARKTNNTMWCWGRPDYTGTNGVDTMATPTQIDANTDWMTLSVQYNHACGYRNGTIYCWGNDVQGGLVAPSLANAPVPTLVTDLSDPANFITGGHHGCRRTVNGWQCFGWNFGGQLGLGNMTSPINTFTTMCP
jgi:alpha-tubulin suppressor-like RCC1 family protein